MLSNGEKLGAAPAYHTKQADGTWRQVSWRQYADEVRQAAKALIARAGAGAAGGGSRLQPPGMGHLRCRRHGGWWRPRRDLHHIFSGRGGVLNHSEAPVVLVENEHQWKKIGARRDALTHLMWW